VKGCKKDNAPVVIDVETLGPINFSAIEDDNRRAQIKEWIERLKKHSVTYGTHQYGVDCNWEMTNVNISCCLSCDGFALWVGNKLKYPSQSAEVERHEQMPDAVRLDFEEAAAIVDRSPRGAAALLRLSIQKLMPFLGEKGDSINDDIAALVQKGLEADIQRAMDILRVVGNNAVHPGQIDLRDDKATALKLFDLLNLIIERRIAIPNRIETLFKDLPEAARKAIEKRDASKD